MAKTLGAIKGFKVVADEDLRRRHDILEQHAFMFEQKERKLAARIVGLQAMLHQQQLEQSSSEAAREAHHEKLLAIAHHKNEDDLRLQASAFTQQMSTRLERLAAQDSAAVNTLTVAIAQMEEEMERLQIQHHRNEREAARSAADKLEEERTKFLHAQVARQEEQEFEAQQKLRQHENEVQRIRMQTDQQMHVQSAKLDAERATCVSALGRSLASLEADLELEKSAWRERWNAREIELSSTITAAANSNALLRAENDGLKAQIASQGAIIEQERMRFAQASRETDAAHAQRWEELQLEIDMARIRDAEERNRLRAENEAQLVDCARSIAALRAQLKSDQAAHAQETKVLQDRLAEHSQALHTAREIIEALRVDVERANEGRRRDAALTEALERSHRMYYLETGLMVQRRSTLCAAPI